MLELELNLPDKYCPAFGTLVFLFLLLLLSAYKAAVLRMLWQSKKTLTRMFFGYIPIIGLFDVLSITLTRWKYRYALCLIKFSDYLSDVKGRWVLVQCYTNYIFQYCGSGSRLDPDSIGYLDPIRIQEGIFQVLDILAWELKAWISGYVFTWNVGSWSVSESGFNESGSTALIFFINCHWLRRRPRTAACGPGNCCAATATSAAPTPGRWDTAIRTLKNYR